MNSLKLFYKVDPAIYRECLDKIRRKFGMHEDIDEEKTILTLDDDSQIEQVRASYNPTEDDFVHVRVVLNDESLRQFFDSVLGEPYRVK